MERFLIRRLRRDGFVVPRRDDDEEAKDEREVCKMAHASCLVTPPRGSFLSEQKREQNRVF